MSPRKKPIRIAFAGASGSSGKTTGLVNLATQFAARGLRVRVIDLDNQGDASQYLGYTEPPYVIADVLGRERVFPDGNGGVRVPTMAEIEVPFYRPTADEVVEYGGRTSRRASQAEWMRRITVIPSGIGSTGLTLSSVMAMLARDHLGADRVRKALVSIDDGRPNHEIPDLEVIDVYGVVGDFTYQSLAIADAVVTAVTPDDKATGRHLNELSDVVDEIADLSNPKLKLAGIIPSRVRPRRDGEFYQDVLEGLEADERYGPLVTTRVRDAVVVPEGFRAGEPLLLWSPAANVTKDYEEVAEWLRKRGVVHT